MENVEINEFKEIFKDRYVMITDDDNCKFKNVLVIKDIENMNINQLKKKIYELKRVLRGKGNHEEIIQNRNVICVICASDLENENLKSLLISLKAIFIKDKLERYTYLYNEACDFLDRKFEENNYCDFKDDICVAKRYCNSNRKKMGCCYHFDSRKIFGKLVLCEHLVNRRCDTKCISCKLVTCDYLNVKFKLKNIVYIDCFFNLIQKLIMKMSCFQTKEVILKRLMFWSL